jgi:D-tyrosyl-tRNA(Tyr) deacylase
MRAVIQRVDEASVTVDGGAVGRIGPGMLVLLGVREDDESADLAFIKKKLLNLRIFNDSEGKLNLPVLDVGGEILLISQFTLYGDCRKGNRPSFSKAARPEKARDLYEKLIAELRAAGAGVASGEFQAMMKVSLVNDGPVTLIVDSRVPRRSS